MRFSVARLWPGNFFRSVRFRLTLWTVAILTIILAIFSVIVYIRQNQELQTDALNRLQVKSQGFEVLYRAVGPFDTDNESPLMLNLSNNGVSALEQGDVFAMINPGGRVVQTAGGISTTTITQLAQVWQQNGTPGLPLPITGYNAALPGAPNKVNFVFLVSPVTTDRRAIGLLILGQPVDPHGQLPRLLLTLVFGSLATLAIAIAGGYWLASRAMSPVRVITRTAQGISDTDLHKRLNMKTKDELGDLANTFDAMLERLEAAFDRQRQFTADASHELRTPLTIVGLEADRALEHPRSPGEYEQVLKTIQSENEFMARLVNDLLTLARMDAGQTRLREEPLDLSDVAVDVTDRLIPIARQQGIELRTGELPLIPITGDRQFLTQMISNLVENAIKYSGSNGKHVCVSTGVENGQQKLAAWVRVEDDGPGIAKEDIPHIFDRFYRVDKARTRDMGGLAGNDGTQNAPEGSGLGLSIVYWIVRAHHGEITVESEVAKGSAFVVHLPLAPTSDQLPSNNVQEADLKIRNI